MESLESLYAKLYDKYERLKTTKFLEIDQPGRDQEEKFKNYVSLAEDLIERLRSENERLQTKLDELKEHVHSIRSCSDEYQKLLMEECEKTQELSREVERLQNLHREEHLHTSEEGDNNNVKTRKRSIDSIHWDSSGGQTGSEFSPTNSLRKKPRLQFAAAQPGQANQLNTSLLTDAEKNSYGGTVSDEDQGLQLANSSLAKPACSGDCTSAESVFKTLMESLLGLAFSFVNEPEGLCFSVLHPSSGYSFSLTWVSIATKEAELLYQVSSLGTIGRVAKDWMKEEIRFSVNMFPFFMKRLSQVLGLHL